MSEHSEQLRAALATRLERVRGAMSDEEFSQLIDDVIRTTQRFEEIEARERATMSISGKSTLKDPQPHPR
jgi:hypothetical protein